ncbi:endonuclease domain-containing protein [Oerskovia sp. NPDC056781]|uniref:endonuclease domain-containing protein n=1 Tax=Oerskovia sp. NPDC056781 TaxID=3345942 RepID=UPI00366BD228
MDRSRMHDLGALCEAVELTFSDGDAWSHTTAAALWGLPLPSGIDLTATLHVSRGPGKFPSEAAGITGHVRPRTNHVTRHRGRPVTTLARTWLDLAGLVRPAALTGPDQGRVDARRATTPSLSSTHELSFTDLVCVTDAIVGRRWPAVPREELARALAWHGSRRGARALRRALAATRAFVDSPMETRVRVLLVASGFPCPVVGADVYDRDRWVARPDLCWPGLRIAIEYDGIHHLTDRQQMLDDVARREELERLGWRVLVLYADDVLRRWPATTGRVMQAFADRGVDPGNLADAPDVAVRPRIVEGA